jgi:hypothetical protein
MTPTVVIHHGTHSLWRSSFFTEMKFSYPGIHFEIIALGTCGSPGTGFLISRTVVIRLMDVSCTRKETKSLFRSKNGG